LDDARPVHSVTLSSFLIGKYEITQSQWKAVMGNTPSYSAHCDNCPVNNVSWDDIKVFISKLNRKTGKNYRLPTEAEWEYAARGGSKSKGYKYSGSNDLNSVAWYDKNDNNKPHAVGSKNANELGIYDMSGNVWEWCSDWSGDYDAKAATNPKGALGKNETSHIVRGGSWFYEAWSCHVALRDAYDPKEARGQIGFRLVLSLQ
jgi:formylglycine-generating enzyme required for sulfatase activity